jgi:putative flippase GtrA
MMLTGKDPSVPAVQRRRSVLRDLARYGAGSVLSLLVILGLSSLAHDVLGWDEKVAVSTAFAASLVLNYAILRLWVFPAQTARVGRQFAQTVGTSVAFRAIEYVLFLVLHGGFGMNYLVATATAVCSSAIAKFTMYRQVVFRSRPAPATPRVDDALG